MTQQPPTAQNTPRHDARALLVGIAAYESVNPLPAAVRNDVAGLRAALLDPACGGYAEGRVKSLCDGEATGAAIRDVLAELKVRCQEREGSTALVYFSGHGGSLTSGPHAGQYLLPFDADASSPRSLANSAISGAELTELLSGIPARRLLVILDCCHAGGIGEPKAILPSEALAGFKAGLTDQAYAQLVNGEGRVLFAASRPEELSWVLRDDENSLFTKHLLAGLKGAAAAKDGLVRVFELFEHVAKAVRDEGGGRQRPVFKCQTEDNFAVALGTGTPPANVPGDGFTYDLYVSFAPDDIQFVYETAIPFLERAGLKVGTSDDLGLGGYRVVNMARGIEKSRRTLLVLSSAYLRHHYGMFEAALGMQLGLDKGQFRLVPLRIERTLDLELPLLLKSLQAADYTHPYHGGERALTRVVDAVKQPIPSM